MLQVKICVNNQPVQTRSCHRTSPLSAVGITPDTICEYRTDRGETIRHRYGDGAHELARKLLNTP